MSNAFEATFQAALRGAGFDPKVSRLRRVLGLPPAPEASTLVLALRQAEVLGAVAARGWEDAY